MTVPGGRFPGFLARLDRFLFLCFGLAGGLALSQFPQYLAQYMQRLGGHVDEAARSAVLFNLPELAARAAELADGLRAITEAAPVMRLIAFIGHARWAIAREALADFTPGLAFTLEELLYLAGGAVLGALFYGAIKWLSHVVINLTRRLLRGRAAHSGSPRHPNDSGCPTSEAGNCLSAAAQEIKGTTANKNGCLPLDCVRTDPDDLNRRVLAGSKGETVLRTALLIVDLQKEFYGNAAAAPSLAAAVENINAALELFHAKDFPVFVVLHRDDESGLVPEAEGFEPPDTLQILPTDHRIVKTYGNAFARTTLGDDLRALGVDTLIIAGYCAEFCVLSTYRGALDLDFHPILLRGGLAGGRPERIRFVEEISDVISCGALAAVLG